jgi:WD40 repeat protein
MKPHLFLLLGLVVGAAVHVEQAATYPADEPVGSKPTMTLDHGLQVISVRYLTDGKTLVSFGADPESLTTVKSIRTWDMTKHEKQSEYTFKTEQRNYMGMGTDHWALAADGKRVALLRFSGMVQIVQMGNGEVERQWKLPTRDSKLSFSPDGEYLIETAIEDDEDGDKPNAIRLWEVGTGKVVRKLQLPPPGANEPIYYSNFITSAPDGKTLAVVESKGGRRRNQVRLWSGQTGKDLGTLKHPDGTGGFTCTSKPFFSPDGQSVIVAQLNTDGDQSRIGLWDARTAKFVRSLGDSMGAVHKLVFAPNGKMVATGDGNGLQPGRTVCLWDVATGKKLKEWKLPGKLVGLAFSPDGETLATAGSDTIIRLWDVNSGKEVRQLSGFGSRLAHFIYNLSHDSTYTPLAFAPDGKSLAACSNSAVAVWALEKTGDKKAGE